MAGLLSNRFPWTNCGPCRPISRRGPCAPAEKHQGRLAWLRRWVGGAPTIVPPLARARKERQLIRGIASRGRRDFVQTQNVTVRARTSSAKRTRLCPDLARSVREQPRTTSWLFDRNSHTRYRQAQSVQAARAAATAAVCVTLVFVTSTVGFCERSHLARAPPCLRRTVRRTAHLRAAGGLLDAPRCLARQIAHSGLRPEQRQPLWTHATQVPVRP